MKTTEYLAKEYRTLTSRYATASQHIKELLRQISSLSDDDKPDFKTVKEMLRELHKLEDLLEYITGRLHFIFHQIMILIKEEDLEQGDKPKKEAAKSPKIAQPKQPSQPKPTLHPTNIGRSRRKRNDFRSSLSSPPSHPLP